MRHLGSWSQSHLPKVKCLSWCFRGKCRIELYPPGSKSVLLIDSTMCCNLQVDASSTISPAHPLPALRTVALHRCFLSVVGTGPAQCLAKGRTWKMLGKKMNENRESCLLFSLEKTAVRENEEMILKESQGPRDTEISVCQGFSKTTLKLLCSQTQLWCSTGKGSQLNSAKGKMHGAETRRDQVHAPKWCLQWSCMEPWNSPSNAMWQQAWSVVNLGSSSEFRCPGFLLGSVT